VKGDLVDFPLSCLIEQKGTPAEAVTIMSLETSYDSSIQGLNKGCEIWFEKLYCHGHVVLFGFLS
jgi:hypothetical protein